MVMLSTPSGQCSMRSGMAELTSCETGSAQVFSFHLALRHAIPAGYEDVLDLVDNSAKYDELIVNDLIDVAAEYERWNSVKTLLGYNGETLHPERLNAVLCWACKHGNNDMILEVMKYGIRPRTETRQGIGKWPIHEAVRAGHINTVQFLLENGAMCDHIKSHAEALGRCVAMSGNFQLFELLKTYWFWKPSCEYNFLPLAAEYGHIEFAKYTIASKPKTRKIEDATMGELLPKEQLHYFSLFRAVVNGRYDIVRLLVQEVGLSLSKPLTFDNQDCDLYRHLYNDSWSTSCSAIVLAVDAGNVDMVRLLVEELGTEPLSKEEWTTFGYPSNGFWKKDRYHMREARKCRLEKWASRLRLGRSIRQDTQVALECGQSSVSGGGKSCALSFSD
ncbi:ankyrin [Bimuria novae-zelandiae CBS 107.79]|uniref:Ankyrin n=1 Tax=Bimuria novae-zelandiae CBS 107.79 TaxID=1447943 RepID=A0A6A5V7W5_9PLEO|nr:ankyrin [Bimuria novae-zelandiae CBS 107.79]